MKQFCVTLLPKSGRQEKPFNIQKLDLEEFKCYYVQISMKKQTLYPSIMYNQGKDKYIIVREINCLAE